MSSEYKLSYTAPEINKRIGMIDDNVDRHAEYFDITDDGIVF